jgi:hypothetical protein
MPKCEDRSRGERRHGALPGLTRRELVVRAGTAVAGLAVVGAAGAQPRRRTPFPGVEEYDADVPIAWFDLALELVRATPGYSPPVASRALAYTGLTLYEALVPGMEGFRSLADVRADLARVVPQAGRSVAYDWPTVANAALASILRSLFPSAPPEPLVAVDALESSFAERLRTGVPPGVFARSVRRGQDVAATLFEWSKGDGGHEGYLDNFPPYDPPSGPGHWVPTPPGFLPALQPYWGSNRCLAVVGGAACPPGDHPPFSEDPDSLFYGEALETYDAVTSLTAEQEEIARFWSDDPGLTSTPPGHSISITTQVLRNESADLVTAAEAYARVGIAVCDAFIACWHQKYVYNLIRPVTYVRRMIDPAWLPLLVTPPFPEYTSGHSIQSGAAFRVLTDLFGERYAFVDHTHDERGHPPRSFGSFSEAAGEAAISRLYGGIHFRSAIENGLVQGTCIGRAVSALPLRV